MGFFLYYFFLPKKSIQKTQKESLFIDLLHLFEMTK